MSHIDKIRAHLFARTGKGIKYDLQKVQEASEHCGNAHRSFKSIHVAGTNGKGSTCACLESMLRYQGYSTGLYTSPHIINFEERFVINGKPVTESQWCEVYDLQKDVIEAFDLTFFEATTLMAFELFRRNNVQWAVIETGLGGRLDATNIIIPEVSVITTIDMDHKEYLGNTIEQVAAEKFGIIKQGIPAVVVFNKNVSIMESLYSICSQKSSPLTIVSTDNYTCIDNGSSLTIADHEGNSYHVSMQGAFQVGNVLAAINAFKAVGLILDENALLGLRNTHIPGRMQMFTCKGKTILLDVGHNSQAASVLVNELSRKYIKQSICILTGIMSDKDYQSMLAFYSSVASRIILTKPLISRAAATQVLRSCVGDKMIVSICENINEACVNALAGEEAVICVTGSFYTVGEACIALSIDPFTLKTN